jgi:hypothetical protein
MSLSTTTQIPPTVWSEITASKSSPETIAVLLNEAEAKHSNLPRHWNSKRVYPFWKTCQHCSKPFATHTKEQAVRNKTCSRECTAAMIGKANSGPMPIEQRKLSRVACAVCGAEVLRADSWLKRVAMPVCSRQCNGKLRGEEWKQHAGKGWSSWRPESKQALAERMTGATNPAWKGGLTYRNRKGAYANQPIRYVRCPAELLTMARKDGYVMEHRLLVAQAIGRPLTRTEAVHHVNHDATDNQLENLMLFATNGQHKAFEHGAAIKPLWSGLSPSTTPARSGA